jgi:hypothetical protein
MKTFNVYIMGLILSELFFTACENDGGNQYGTTGRIPVENKIGNEFVKQFAFEVSARNWRRSSSIDRYVQVSIPDITRKIMREGAVIIYLNEAGKKLALPFTYYQVRRAMSFQPSYEEGYVYINIFGNFILNVHASYLFNVVVVNARGLSRFKHLDWYDYEEVKEVLMWRDTIQ